MTLELPVGPGSGAKAVPAPPEPSDATLGCRRVIGDGHALPDGQVRGLGDEDLLELHRRMVLLRTYDERSLAYHRQGRIGTYALYWGHEAMQVGAVSALARRDWVFPSYRESAVALMRGMPPAVCLAWWRGDPRGHWDPRQYGVASIAVPVGTQVPHAVGWAWGMRLRGEDACALAFFGDGATSEGSFHEGATIAAVMRAPVVLLCNNNQWAISTPLSTQTAARAIVDKAVGYGMPGMRVDGGDVLAVYEAVREAAELARAGGGPTLVEAVTYRMAAHATADDPSRYLDEERAAGERRHECLTRFEAYLMRRGVLTPERADEARLEALELMRDAIAEAESAPLASVDAIFDTVYADAPPSLAADRDECLRAPAS